MSAFAHRFILGDGSGKTLLLLHGTGGNEESLIELGEAVAPGWSLLGIRGNSLEECHPRFFRRISEGVLDEEDVRFRASELAQFLAWAAKDYSFKLEFLWALGYSNGANMASAILLLYPDSLAGGAMLRPMVPLRPDPLPDLSGKRALLIAGEEDTITWPYHAEEIAELLKSASADVRLEWIPGGHGLSRRDVELAKGHFESVG